MARAQVDITLWITLALIVPLLARVAAVLHLIARSTVVQLALEAQLAQDSVYGEIHMMSSAGLRRLMNKLLLTQRLDPGINVFSAGKNAYPRADYSNPHTQPDKSSQQNRRR